MALVEIEGDTLAELQRELNAAKPSKVLLDKLGANPAHRRKMLSLLKEADPTLNIPEIDAAAPVLDEVAALRKRLDDSETARQAEKDEAAKEKRQAGYASTIEKAHADLRSRGFTDDGIKKLEEMMTARGLVDYEAGEALFEKTQPKDEPAMTGNYGRNWDFFAAPESSGEDIKAALGQPKGPGQERALRRWTDNELRNGLAELRGGSTRRAAAR